MDLIVPPLAKLTGVEEAGRVFIALTMLSLVGGTIALHRALHGRIGLWPICSLLFVYNAVLYWGFLNCLFGVGFSLLAFAGWISTCTWKTATRLGLFAVVASVLFVLHLFAFGLYALAVASYEVGIHLRKRHLSQTSFAWLCVVASQFLPAIVLWGASAPNVGPSFTSYGTFYERAYAALAPVTFGQASLPFDRFILLFCIGFWIVMRASRSLTLAPEMRFPLAMMLLTAALMPNWLAGSWGAAYRLPVALPFILIGSTRVDAPKMRVIAPFALVAIAILTTRVWTVSQIWRDYAAQFAEFRVAARAIPAGSRLLVVEGPIPDADRAVGGLPLALALRSPSNYYHLALLAVLDRGAFVPSLFTGWYPVEPAARNARMSHILDAILTPAELIERADPHHTQVTPAGDDVLGESPCCFDWPQSFDFVLWIDFGRPPQTLPAALRPFVGREFFHIYRVIRP